MRNGLPSGEQIELRSGSQRVVVTEVGAGLRTYTVGGRAVLDGYGPDEMASDGRGQVLVPWPNRVQGGAYEFAGSWCYLPLNEQGTGNAIHGLVRWAPWLVTGRSPASAVLTHTLHPQPGYPFSLALSLEYALSGGGLRVTCRATNVGRRACPYGAGAHPYLAVGSASVDTVTLRAPGRTVIQTDREGIPTGRRPVERTEYDFRRPRPIGATRLDHTFTDLERDDDGLARVELRDAGAETATTIWLEESYPYLQLFTGDPLPGVGRRSIAVEPMTCPPNAFRSGEAVVLLAPGEAAESSWGIQPAVAGNADPDAGEEA
jgi:aldose 1-epimerase